MKHGANNSERRVCFNHPNPQLEEALRRAFFRVEDGGLRHSHFPRGLRAAFSGFLSEAFGKSGQFLFGQQFCLRHEEIFSKHIQFSYTFFL